MGDSLSAAFGIERTQGWVNLLQDHLNSKGKNYKVINASVSGETTRGGLTRLPRSLKRHQPTIVIIALGGNDGLRGLPLKEFRKNLEAMVTLAKSSKAKVVLCGVRIPPNLGLTYVSEFIYVYTETAQKHNIPLVQYLLKNVSSKTNLMQNDGIHPTAEAQPIILKNVLSGLNNLI
ncbi:Arylesterase precursor [hydrothermal vent metagenome]|uniref:Arylesterase n=1 Tax=hydrothermal vent metagenome TaxID=652676 RepID=A0A3B0ZKS3_9ZZZZ